MENFQKKFAQQILKPHIMNDHLQETEQDTELDTELD